MCKRSSSSGSGSGSGSGSSSSSSSNSFFILGNDSLKLAIYIKRNYNNLH